jgi:dTDP-4-amino-4,6-dideoxygalactose transaminase
MIRITDYSNPFQAVFDFETELAKFTGAPYCITTDCCTHAIEIAFRLSDHNKTVTFPAYTYLSVPMTMHKLNIQYSLTDTIWRDYYKFEGSRVWDCARYLKQDMYVPGSIQCNSFGRSKPLEVGLGGCILTDDAELYRRASMMRYDGRDLRINPWIKQKEFTVGYHYYMRPEECVTGLNLLAEKKFTPQLDQYFDYPDVGSIFIEQNAHV